jgi:membrane protease YdiL (CAAX protease family)
MFAIVGLIAACGGVRLELAADRAWEPLVYGVYMFLFVALLEENLCRGFLFQRLTDGAGFWVAQIAFGAVFVFGHWENPGMSGVTKVIASVDLFLGAILLGLAWRRTRSLALPVGIHLGWNWTQGFLLGFDVSGIGAPGWFHPQLLGDAVWLNGGAFGPEASVFAIVVDIAVIALLWRWRPQPLRERTAAIAAESVCAV